ncbi:MAG: DEAD/DEAH box helicase [Propionibacteriaceae bacterium]|jgi:ATP-dependent RNA helicase HelY|nr:DEAD/DEAH box helicase [Propionibacteriaceae bacterium]
MSIADFAARYPFELEQYQLDACAAIAARQGVLVAAPTGAGKTVVGEFACYLAVAEGSKCFYTTPIKALSNQKYHDLVRRHGEEQVGLLTGDTSINGEAPVVVMTTEVLRNMIYARSSTLDGLGYVVMDEVHYLSDRFRGAAWEEVIISLAADVQLVALSATVSNAEEFGQWLNQVRGDVALVVTEKRPVPLFQHVMAGRQLYDLFNAEATAVNPELVRLAKQEAGVLRDDARRPRGRSGNGKRRVTYGSGRFGGAASAERTSAARRMIPKRETVLEQLTAAELTPAIYFIFSRAGCDKAVRQLLKSGLRFTTRAEYAELAQIAARHTEQLSDADLWALGWGSFKEAFCRGFTAHHAGLLPAIKECVEEAFTAGLIKAVFATETLALGINMPARSVVIEKLVKYNGESHADITPGEYTQLTGRAGRRGIDVEGHAVVLWAPGMDPRALSSLASSRTFPLNSSFAPSYNMAVNLVATVGQERARELLLLSFAQFQADAALERRLAAVPRRRNGKETARAQKRTNTIADRFDRVCGVLEALGYLEAGPDAGLQITPQGQLLQRIYSELDLVTVEAIKAGILDNLRPPQLAAILSSLVYESRNSYARHRMPDRACETAESRLRGLWNEVGRLERDFRLPAARPLDIGFAEPVYDWTNGAELSDVLTEDLSAGDFVRWTRQVIDQASQLANAVPGTQLATTARLLIAQARRGVVDISPLED